MVPIFVTLLQASIVSSFAVPGFAGIILSLFPSVAAAAAQLLPESFQLLAATWSSPPVLLSINNLNSAVLLCYVCVHFIYINLRLS